MPPLARSGPATVVFLGAGFSRVADVPLAGEIFDEEPVVDRLVRKRLVQAVRARWLRWHDKTGGSPEEHLAELEGEGGIPWAEAVWYVSLVIALRMGDLREISFRRQLQLTKQNLTRRSVSAHEEFWTAIFTSTPLLAVITTNYDILAERGFETSQNPECHVQDSTTVLEKPFYMEVGTQAFRIFGPSLPQEKFPYSSSTDQFLGRIKGAGFFITKTADRLLKETLSSSLRCGESTHRKFLTQFGSVPGQLYLRQNALWLSDIAFPATTTR